MLFRPNGGPRVIVAHECETIAQQIGVVLLDAGFAPLRAQYGSQALGLLDRFQPVALVVDVALSDVMSFQLIDHLRRKEELRGVKVVLVASVFNKVAYKRRPTTLYGADDYVEQHHIPDMLPRKLCRLLGMGEPGDGTAHLERCQSIHDGEVRTDLSGSERVRALARSIVADIALYNEAELGKCMQQGNLGPLESALAEGRRLLAEMSPAGDLPAGDPIMEAFEALVEEMRQVR